VGQLAIDVVIATFTLQKVGTLTSPHVVPMIGNDAIGSPQGTLVTALEVFSCPDQRVVFLQQRSPIIKGKQSQFVHDLLSWYTNCSMASIILLGSVDKSTRMDDSLLVGYG
jgi:proteasome assembly chaperone 2